MRICVISTTVMTCPPTGYSGLEMLAWQQATGLANKGHNVTLVAPKGSFVPPTVELHETSLGESEKMAYSGYWHKLPNFDCIIDHSWQKWSMVLKMEGQLKAPVLMWMHAPAETMYSRPPDVPKPCFVSISIDQSKVVQELYGRETRVCYNGVDPGFYRIIDRPRNNRYLFLSRMSTIKGPDIAIEAAKTNKQMLDLVGDDAITAEPDFAKSLRYSANTTPGIRYIGNQSREQCVIWFNMNKALIHPVMRYREPFGLAPVEAQLCGMPVIAWDNGAMRETVAHGETGYIVRTMDELNTVLKSGAVSDIKAKTCRDWAMQFSYDNMIDRCAELCEEAASTGGW